MEVDDHPLLSIPVCVTPAEGQRLHCTKCEYNNQGEHTSPNGKVYNDNSTSQKL